MHGHSGRKFQKEGEKQRTINHNKKKWANKNKNCNVSTKISTVFFGLFFGWFLYFQAMKQTFKRKKKHAIINILSTENFEILFFFI